MPDAKKTKRGEIHGEKHGEKGETSGKNNRSEVLEDLLVLERIVCFDS